MYWLSFFLWDLVIVAIAAGLVTAIIAIISVTGLTAVLLLSALMN